MRIHVISIGGRIMHNLALVMHRKGNIVTGSDDEIYEPSRSVLANENLLPDQMGWNPDQITSDIDLVILGMHAKADNPEIKRAQELGLTIYSYPEFIAEFSKDKNRVVIAGSHGKTTTTSMIMHVLKKSNVDFDYLVGAHIEGFDGMVKLSDSPLIIIEGDEYLSSAIDRSPKMLHYKPDIAVITGIAWDHINVFPSFEFYVEQFDLFVKTIKPNGSLYYYKHDAVLSDLLINKEYAIPRIAYGIHTHDKRGKLIYQDQKFDISVFGDHNLANMSAAMCVCEELGIDHLQFIKMISDFKGADKRLEIMHLSEELIVYRDFAHAPSKVKATLEALVQKHPKQTIKVIIELHTYSSLNVNFLPHYKDSIPEECSIIIYYDNHTLKMKGMDPLDPNFVLTCFDHSNAKVIANKEQLSDELDHMKNENIDVLAILSSGNLSGIDLQSKINEI